MHAPEIHLTGALNRTGWEGGNVGCRFKQDGVSGKCCVCMIENKGELSKTNGRPSGSRSPDPCEQFWGISSSCEMSGPNRAKRS